MGTDQGFLVSETRFSSDRTVVFEDNDEGYGSTKITFRAMYKDDLRKTPTVDVVDDDVVIVDNTDSLSRIIDDCFSVKCTDSPSLSSSSTSSNCAKTCLAEESRSVNSNLTETDSRSPTHVAWRSHRIQAEDRNDGQKDGQTDAVTDQCSSRNARGGSDWNSNSRADVPWKERKTNIDNALSWLRNELEGMRAQDKLLMSQLQRCRETIDSLKQQRSCWEDGSEYGDLDEEEEEHWEDWEIAEYERKYAENPEFSLESEEVREKLSRDSSETSNSRNSRDHVHAHAQSCGSSSDDGRSNPTERANTTERRRTGTQCTDRMSRRSQSMESSSSSGGGSLSERRVAKQYSESSPSSSTKGLYFRQDIEVTV